MEEEQVLTNEIAVQTRDIMKKVGNNNGSLAGRESNGIGDCIIPIINSIGILSPVLPLVRIQRSKIEEEISKCKTEVEINELLTRTLSAIETNVRATLPKNLQYLQSLSNDLGLASDLIKSQDNGEIFRIKERLIFKYLEKINLPPDNPKYLRKITKSLEKDFLVDYAKHNRRIKINLPTVEDRVFTRTNSASLSVLQTFPQWFDRELKILNVEFYKQIYNFYFVIGRGKLEIELKNIYRTYHSEYKEYIIKAGNYYYQVLIEMPIRDPSHVYYGFGIVGNDYVLLPVAHYYGKIEVLKMSDTVPAADVESYLRTNGRIIINSRNFIKSLEALTRGDFHALPIAQINASNLTSLKNMTSEIYIKDPTLKELIAGIKTRSLDYDTLVRIVDHYCDRNEIKYDIVNR